MLSSTKYLDLLGGYRVSYGWLKDLNEIRCEGYVELGHFKANNIRSEMGLIFLSWVGNRPLCNIKRHKKRGGYTLYLSSQLFKGRAWLMMQKLYYITFVLYKDAGLKNVAFKGLVNKYFERVNLNFSNNMELQAFLTWRLIDIERKYILTPLLARWAITRPNRNRFLSEFYFRSSQIPMAYYYVFKDKNIWFY